MRKGIRGGILLVSIGLILMGSGIYSVASRGFNVWGPGLGEFSILFGALAFLVGLGEIFK